MTDPTNVIGVIRMALEAVDAAALAIKTASAALADGKAELSMSLAHLAELDDRLATQRGAADKKLDDKFDP